MFSVILCVGSLLILLPQISLSTTVYKCGTSKYYVFVLKHFKWFNNLINQKFELVGIYIVIKLGSII